MIKNFKSFTNIDKIDESVTSKDKEIKKLLKSVDKKHAILSFQTSNGDTWKLAIIYDIKLELYSLQYVKGKNNAQIKMGTILSIDSYENDGYEDLVILVEDALK